MQHKQFEFKLEALDYEGRTIEGYAAVFGNKDLGGDIIHPGAFTKTLAERGGKVRFLWQHQPGEPIGKVLEMREDPRGLYVKAIISDTQRGRDALALLRDGAINGMSIGYEAIPGGTDYTKDTDGDAIRNLRELKLWEFSLATFPMNEEANVTALKMVQPYGDLPLAPRERAWDGAAAESRVRAWADAEEAPNDRYARAFMWHNADGENFGDYKLGFADVVDGELTAIPRGLFAVVGALQGARAELDIPDADQARIRGVVERYYAKMRSEFEDESIVAPWNKSAKMGRAISAANRGRIELAIEAARNAINTLEELLDATGVTDDDYDEMSKTAPANAGRESNEAGPSETPTSAELARKRKLLQIQIEQAIGG